MYLGTKIPEHRQLLESMIGDLEEAKRKEHDEKWGLDDKGPCLEEPVERIWQ